MIINSIQGGGREVLGSHAALRWGGRDLQSALNRTVSCLCDCQVGHYWLIRALFFCLCSSDWAEQAAPSSALSQCNQALLSPQLPFSPLWFPPTGPHYTTPPHSLSPPSATAPTSPHIRRVPIYSKEKGSRQKSCPRQLKTAPILPDFNEVNE